MKKLSLLLVSIFSILFSNAQTNSIDYFGQTPPGTTPVKFANGTISKSNAHGRLVMSADGKEIFWTTLNMSTFATQIFGVKYSGGQWSQPAAPSFAVSGMTKNPVLSKDGNKLFYDYKGTTDVSWSTKFIEKTDTGWTAPRNDGFLLKTSSSFTDTGMVYFSDTMSTRGTYGGIYNAQFTEYGYVNKKALSSIINGNSVDYTPYISPAEDYLLFSTSRPSTVEQFGKMFIFISFRNNDKTWTTPVKLFSVSGRFPSISPDGKYLFFCGDDMNIYWVDINVLEQFRPTTAITENKLRDVSVFPNPTNGLFTVFFGFVPNSNADIEIFNTDGKLFLSENLQNKLTGTIDLTNCPAGTYLVKILVDKNITLQRFKENIEYRERNNL